MFGLLLTGLVLGTALPSRAQQADSAPLLQRIERLEAEFNDLRAFLHRGEGSLPKPLPGQSQAPATAAATSENQERAAQMQLKITALEQEIRRLTGDIERVVHLSEQAQQRLDKLVEDVDFRLTTLERALASGATAGPLASGTPGTPGSPASPGAAAGSANQRVIEQAPEGTKVLGALPLGRAPVAREVPTEPEKPKGILPEGSPAERYKFAFGAIRRLDLPRAEQGFREFIAAHGDDPLAENAHYWLGETFYVRGDYVEAAKVFNEGYQRAPEGKKAPDNLLKLAMSLGRLGQTDDACAAFEELFEKLADRTAQPLLDRAAKERTRAGCQ
ncbi:MAG: tol-pal system protein YbgF [Alphaproteobacteria bacterium]|jgi:tol-pal system protein YbgF|nr:tol-pal system protein YbgF [Alphaproteobacteria bacterium]MDP6271925.1 tol-pal system protein YbgF [Alphaproteobacteria bacterium]MDP7164370.1 tol-pal system protein YbgF [Alphaproteobacteria bacterium]MDP7428798.1 tol-pal system protein YbgF [Alphaproteobacteria bacterium]